MKPFTKIESMAHSDLSVMPSNTCYTTMQDKFHLVSLGWVADSESGFETLELSEEAIAKELLKRHRSERACLLVEVEHAMDEASTLATLRHEDPDVAATKAKYELLKKGIGVSFWLLDTITYSRWKLAWEQRYELIEPWLESRETRDYDSAFYDALVEQFWSFFRKPPLTRISVAAQSMGQKEAQKGAREIWQHILKKLDDSETNV